MIPGLDIVTGSVLAGGNLLSGYLGANASRDAAQMSADAARYGIDVQNNQWLQTQRNMQPWLDAGTNALSAYSGYGRSHVNPGDYIPGSDIPQFNVASDIPEFDPSQFDLYKDPSYQFRLEEQNRGIDRASAGMGKLMSGNRLEEIMNRSGQMASQEYGNAYNRMLGEYGIKRENEATQYGRGIDAYNAALQRENALYGRGLASYGREYGAEQDYLNRLASISNLGQTGATNMGSFGAANAGATARGIQSAANANAAGAIGQANAWGGAIGDLTSLYGYMNRGGYDPMNYNGQYGGIPTNAWLNSGGW